MSIAAQCSDCCTCPTATTEWDSRSASLTKTGYAEFGTASTPPKIYSVRDVAGTLTHTPPAGTNTYAETYSIGVSGTLTMSGYVVARDSATCTWPSVPFGWDEGFVNYVSGSCGGTPTTLRAQRILRNCGSADWTDEFFVNSVDTSATVRTHTGCSYNGTTTGTVTETLSSEYTTSALIANAIAALPAYDDDWNDTAGSTRNVSTDELSVALRESRYRHRFKIPKVGFGTCYRLEWVERFIAEAGVSLTSAEIVTRGVYRPTVTITGDGTGAEAVAVMASDGTVDFFRVLNPGEGYTAATVIVQAAINGGTTATGTAVLSGGQLASITKTASGDYLPTGALSGGGGSGATITFTLDDTGGLATCPLGSGGSAYTSAPALTITPKVSGTTAARVDLHLGTETAKCIEWDGEVPEDYDPDDPSTYPILGDGVNPYFELPVPAADGTTLIANLRAFCDCSDCS